MTTATINRTASLLTHGPDKAITLALSLAQAERAILAFTAGQVDAVVDADGQAYLLRPAKEHLRQSEARLQALLESSTDVITLVSSGGLILSESLAAKRVLGFLTGELEGKILFDFIHPDDLPHLKSAFYSVLEYFRSDALVEFRHRRRDGSWLMLEATVGNMRDHAGTSIVLICRDTTRRMRMAEEAALRETKLIEEALAKDRFIATLSHELRTPLSPIKLGVEELHEDERFVEARPTLGMIRRNVDVQTQLLEELFDFTKVGEHKVRIRLEEIDAHQTVGFVLETCKSEISAAEMKVQLDLGAVGRMVLADSVRLQQVMWNLVKNAIKFSIPGGSISIRSANDAAGDLVLHFIDHGIGIEAGMLPLIFEPFHQGHHAHLSGGLGLGLFIARGMVEAQNGTLTVASEGQGKGSTFSLILKAMPSDHSREDSPLDHLAKPGFLGAEHSGIPPLATNGKALHDEPITLPS